MASKCEFYSSQRAGGWWCRTHDCDCSGDCPSKCWKAPLDEPRLSFDIETTPAAWRVWPPAVDPQMAEKAAAWDELSTKLEAAHAYCQTYLMPEAWGANVWHAVLADAFMMRRAHNRLKELVAALALDRK